MRLWVRPGVGGVPPFGVSRTLGGIPDAPKTEALDQLPTLSPGDLIPGVPTVEKKRKLFPEPPSAYPNYLVSPDSTHIPVEENYPHCLSRKVVRPR